MPKIYSENEKKIIYDCYIFQPKKTLAEISALLVPHQIRIKPKSLSWTVASWGWTIHRNLSRYLDIAYPFDERDFVYKLPPSILDKVSKDNIKKINALRKKQHQNRRYRQGITDKTLIQKVDIIDITSNGVKEFKAISEIVKADTIQHKSGHNDTPLPNISSQQNGQRTAFNLEEEKAFVELKRVMFSYSKLNHSIERLMGDIFINYDKKLTLLELFAEIFDRLREDGSLEKRQELISMRQQDLSNESTEQMRVHKSLTYNYVNQGLRDESNYHNGLVRKVNFKDKDGNDATGVVTDEEKYEMGEEAGTIIDSKPARLTGKHIQVMASMRHQIANTQINNNISVPLAPIKKPEEVIDTFTVEQLEEKTKKSMTMIDIIKNAEKNLQTTRLDDCDDKCSHCHIKMSCVDSTLKDGMGYDEL